MTSGLLAGNVEWHPELVQIKSVAGQHWAYSYYNPRQRAYLALMDPQGWFYAVLDGYEWYQPATYNTKRGACVGPFPTLDLALVTRALMKGE